MEYGENSRFKFLVESLIWILGGAFIFGAGFVIVKKLKKKRSGEFDFIDKFQLKKKKRKPKKNIPDLDEEKSYIYDPDEPRLK